MKIEINLDIEAIVREAIRNNASTNNVTINTKNSPKGIAWEFESKPGRRRTTEEMALHILEKEKGRLLTPEEKGEAKAFVEIDETAENKAKEDTIKKIHIDNITAEGMAAASKELAEEEQEEHESMHKEVKEAEIPKTKDLTTLDSLFS